MPSRKRIPALLFLALAVCLLGQAGPSGRGGGASSRPAQQGRSRGPQGLFRTNVPDHPLDVILARPTATSVTISVLSYADAKACVAYGTARDNLNLRTEVLELKKDSPREIVLANLKADNRYYYQLRDSAGGPMPPGQDPWTFHTQRPPGAAFVFTVQADSHLDEHTSPEVYLHTLANARADSPDFHIDLGDTFMTEKHDSRDSAFKQYLAQRFYFGQLCTSAPLFLVLGNHDGESPRGRGSEADSLAVWSNTMRTRYFPNPVPDGFYTGDEKKHAEAGLLQDYYAWEWGDALFVALDPFWYTQRQRGQRDNWSRSLGVEQCQWLSRTLVSSHAKFKFVFIHHLVGGLDDQSRGGAEAAGLFEWGGKGRDGNDAFKEMRPAWPMPIHQMLVQNHVSAVFHGHDHLYAKQDLDGIVYQEVPQPGDPKGSTRSASDYGYKSGTILGSSGHLRIAVSPNQVKVGYVRDDKSVAHSYVIPDNAGK